VPPPHLGQRFPAPPVITFIGSFAALLTAVCWIPQVLRTWRRGTAEDFAWPYLALLVTGVASWCLYGILREDPPIYLCNGFVLCMVLVITAVKLRSLDDETVQSIEASEIVEDGVADLDEVG
jgi:MtN3 and saliva related transmembrane protein